MTYNQKQLYFATLDYIWDRAYSKEDLLVELTDIDECFEPEIHVNIYETNNEVLASIVLCFMDDHCEASYRKHYRYEVTTVDVTTFDEIKAIFDLIDSYRKEDDI